MKIIHRPQDAGKDTEYTMAMHNTDFFLLREMVREQLKGLEGIKHDAKVKPWYALLVVINASMEHPAVSQRGTSA